MFTTFKIEHFVKKYTGGTAFPGFDLDFVDFGGSVEFYCSRRWSLCCVYEP